jgi:energy-coupling factor transport system ATP-binding protein
MEGRVAISGLDTRDHPVSELFAHVGLVFQNPEAQLFNSTVERELAFGLESLGLRREDIRRRVDESAEITGIHHLLDRNPHQLSGGEQQLVAITAALALRPQIIVLDEPYASLDAANVRRVRTALRQIHRRGTAIVVAEHRLQNVVADAERMLVLDEGRLVLDGPPRQVLAEDVFSFGLNLPPVVRVARALRLPEIALDLEELVAAVNGAPVPAEALPAPSAYATIGTNTVLRAESITFSFERKPILQDLSLTVDAGECLAVVGANGSGKTTLIKHFNGLHRPDRGRVLVLGQDTRRTKTSQLARHVGLAFQNASHQFFKFQVEEEIELAARALDRYDEAWIRELVALFRLEPILERSPYRLSEGEKKRVAFAAALAAQPDILVLDEPTTGQDWLFRRALGDLVKDLRAREQTVVLVTHDLEFAEHCANRWSLLGEGQVLADGHPEDVMADGAAMRRTGLEPTQSFEIRQALMKETI